MEIKNKLLKDLNRHPNNARLHDDQQLRQIASSIKEFGFTNPVLIDETNTILAGHGRVAAAQTIELKEIPTITLSHLTESQKIAYVLADNQLALNATWNLDALNKELSKLVDVDYNMNIIGFDETYLNDILQREEINFEAGIEDDQGQLDELDPKYVDCPHCGKEFDLRKT